MSRNTPSQPSCVSEFCTAWLCACCCTINSAVQFGPKTALDLLSTFLCICEKSSVCFTMRHERTMLTEYQKMNATDFFQDKTYHRIDNVMRETSFCSVFAAPYATAFFAYGGMLSAISDKVREKYNMGEKTSLTGSTQYS